MARGPRCPSTPTTRPTSLRDGGKSIGPPGRGGQYGHRVGVPNILKPARPNIPCRATFYVPAVVALLYPDEQRRVVAEGTRESVFIRGSTKLNSVLPYGRPRKISCYGPAGRAWKRTTQMRPVGARTASWDFSPHHACGLPRRWACSTISSLMGGRRLLRTGAGRARPTGVVRISPWNGSATERALLHDATISRACGPTTPPTDVFDIFRARVSRPPMKRGGKSSSSPAILTHHRLPIAYLDHRGTHSSCQVRRADVWFRNPCPTWFTSPGATVMAEEQRETE